MISERFKRRCRNYPYRLLPYEQSAPGMSAARPCHLPPRTASFLFITPSQLIGVIHQKILMTAARLLRFRNPLNALLSFFPGNEAPDAIFANLIGIAQCGQLSFRPE